MVSFGFFAIFKEVNLKKVLLKSLFCIGLLISGEILIFEGAQGSEWSTPIMHTLVSQASSNFGVPEDLIYAIMSVESGLWPWSLHSNGKSYYFSTREEAVAFAKKHEKKGNLNIGLMQIYWPVHKKAFKDLSKSFEPRNNIFFAAQLLKDLKQQWGSWEAAVKAYNSAIPKYGNIYKKKIEKELEKPLHSYTD